MLLVGSKSKLSFIPFTPRNQIVIGESTFDKESICNKIDSLIPDEHQIAYLHGSNSASLESFFNAELGEYQGCLLGQKLLTKFNVKPLSGEITDANFQGQYDDQPVCAFPYRKGFQCVSDELNDYCGRNCTDGRYPVIYVISQDSDMEDVAQNEARCNLVKREHILGILVPANHLAQNIDRFNIPGLNSLQLDSFI
jgi:hypothetical protein